MESTGRKLASGRIHAIWPLVTEKVSWRIMVFMQVDATPARGGGRAAILSSFMLGHFSHHLCTAALVPLLPMIRETLALDYTQSGLLLSSFSLTFGLATLPMSAAADRLSSRFVLAVGLCATGGACLAFGLSGDFLQSVLVLVFLGVAAATYHAPASAFLSQVFGKAARGRSLGIHVIGGSAGLTVAPIVAVFVANYTGNWRNAFLVLGLPAIVAGVLIWATTAKQEATNKLSRSGPDDGGLNIFAVVRLLGFLVVIAAITTLLVSGVNSFLPLYLVDKHGVSNEVAGLMVGVFYGANLIGSYNLKRERNVRFICIFFFTLLRRQRIRPLCVELSGVSCRGRLRADSPA